MDEMIFSEMNKAIATADNAREKLIRKSRDCLKASKSAISALVRNQPSARVMQESRKHAAAIVTAISRNPALACVGSASEALEEYAEAECIAAIISGKPLPSIKGMQAHTYLAGLCDATGEALRAAMAAALEGDRKKPKLLRDRVAALHASIMTLDLHNHPVRRKTDSLNRNLEKLDELALALELGEVRHGKSPVRCRKTRIP